MTEGKPGYQWSELNDEAVIEAMLINAESEHWNKCSAFIRYLIEKRFSNLSPQFQADTIQDILLSVHKNLPTFRYQSKFTTWLTAIARNRTIDVLRLHAEITRRERHLDDLPENHESDIESSTSNVPRTPEEIVLTKERIREVIIAIEVFLQLHTKPERNRQILQMVLFHGYSYEEAAQALGINAPVVGHVVRSARIYLDQKVSHAPDDNDLPE